MEMAGICSGTMGNVSGDGETEYWLSVLGLRESLAQSEEDIAAGRTYGEAEVRSLQWTCAPSWLRPTPTMHPETRSAERNCGAVTDCRDRRQLRADP